MQPLLNIQSVSISIECSTKKASLQVQQPAPSVNVTRNRGRSDISTDPVRVKIDTYEARASIGRKTARRSIEEFGSAGRSAGLEATRAYAERGNQMLDSHGKGNPIADIARARSLPEYQTTIAYVPTVGPQFSVEGGTISFDFSMDQLVFDWNVHHRPQMEYVPGNVSFQVTQYPQVIIEYMGKPIYVPPSADPDAPAPVLDATV